jgi:hypothetical protein
MTGFIVGAVALLWDEVLDILHAWSSNHGEAKKPLRRAA